MPLYPNPGSVASTLTEPASTTTGIGIKVSGDAVNRYQVGADGKTQWGDGTNPLDVNLYRYAATGLATDSTLKLNTAGTLLLGSAGDTSIARASAGVANFSNPATPHSATWAVDGNALVGTTTALGDNGAGEIQLATASTVPTTNPTGGTLLYCSASGHAVQRNSAGQVSVLGGSLATTTSTTTIANSAALTSLQSFTIPGNDPIAASVYRMIGYGVYSVTGTPTLTFALYWGGIAGTILASVPAVTATSGITSAPFYYEAMVCFQSTTACTAVVVLDIDSSAVTDAVSRFVGTPTAATSGLTTTSNQALTMGFTWSAASASNTISLLGGSVYLER